MILARVFDLNESSFRKTSSETIRKLEKMKCETGRPLLKGAEWPGCSVAHLNLLQ